jgi:predicted methyltransferase
VISRLRRWLCAAGSRQDLLRDPDAVIAALEVRPGMAVGDLGPGAGHFTLRLARAVEPHGVVYALDTNPRTLDELPGLANEREIRTLRAVPVPRDGDRQFRAVGGRPPPGAPTGR